MNTKIKKWALIQTGGEKDVVLKRNVELTAWEARQKNYALALNQIGKKYVEQ